MNDHSYRVRELPPELEILADLATDLRWTWSHAGDADAPSSLVIKELTHSVLGLF